MFNTLVKELGSAIGLDDLAPDETSAVTLAIDGVAFSLQYYDEGEEIYIIHRIASLPYDAQAQAAVQRYLLESNCFFRAVGPGVLGIEANEIFYTVRVACRDKSDQCLSGNELEHILRSVVDACSELRNGCSQIVESTQSYATTDELDFHSMLRV